MKGWQQNITVMKVPNISLYNLSYHCMFFNWNWDKQVTGPEIKHKAMFGYDACDMIWWYGACNPANNGSYKLIQLRTQVPNWVTSFGWWRLKVGFQTLIIISDWYTHTSSKTTAFFFMDIKCTSSTFLYLITKSCVNSCRICVVQLPFICTHKSKTAAAFS